MKPAAGAPHVKPSKLACCASFRCDALVAESTTRWLVNALWKLVVSSMLAVLDLNGGLMALARRASQLCGLKKAWLMMSSALLSVPSRWLGSRSSIPSMMARQSALMPSYFGCVLITFL